MLETPDGDFYYEHKPVNGYVSVYIASNSTPIGSYDLSQNADYTQYGFIPTPPAVQVNRFWGSEYSWGACGSASNGVGCFRGQYRRYFVMWKSVSGPSQTGVTESCPCP